MLNIIKKYFIQLIIVIMIIGCSSTKTNVSQYEEIDKNIYLGNYQTAITQIESSKDKVYKEKDKVLYFLNLGILYHYSGQYEKSNDLLTKAEFAMEDLFTKSVSKLATSLLLNDNALDYSGEDYEDIYLNVFKALNYIHLNEKDASFVEINRINLKLDKLDDKYKDLGDKMGAVLASKMNKEDTEEDESENDENVKIKAEKNKFHNDALGKLLSMLLYRSDNDWDDAQMDLDKIKEAWHSQGQIYNFDMPQLDSYLETTDDAKINIFSFIGKSPIKKAATYYITTFDGYVNITSTEPIAFSETMSWPCEEGKHFKFSLPYMVKTGSDVSRISVIIDGVEAQELNMIENMENVAHTTFKVKAPITYIKSVARTILKGLAAEQAKDKMDKQIANPYLSFAAKLATNVAVDMTENADLRISRFFPSKAMIGEIEVSPGMHNVIIKYFDINNQLLYTDDQGVIFAKASELNLVESFYLQ